MPSSSSALSILFAYSPMIQIKEALASGSSSSSRLAHSVGMIPSYCDGYFLKISWDRDQNVIGWCWVTRYLHHNHGFLDNVANPRSNEIQ